MATLCHNLIDNFEGKNLKRYYKALNRVLETHKYFFGAQEIAQSVKILPCPEFKSPEPA